jgi:hypothetical protein
MRVDIGPEYIVAYVSESGLTRLAAEPRPLHWHILMDHVDDDSLVVIDSDVPSRRLLDIFLDWLAAEKSISARSTKSWLASNSEWFSTMSKKLDEGNNEILLFVVSQHARQLLAAFHKRRIDDDSFSRAAQLYGVDDRNEALSAFHFFRGALQYIASNPGYALLIAGSK